MDVFNLSKGTFHQYKYSLGSAAGPKPPKKIIVDGYVTECQTLYICQWGALCGGDINNYYSTVTESYDGCTSPTDGPICDGEYLQYQYVGATTQQDCQQVWVDDPPPPPSGGGGSSVTTIVNNIQNSSLKKVLAAIGNPKLTNTIEALLQEFGTNKKLTYTFSDDYTGTDPAKTTAVKSADGTITGYNIQLNAAKISGYSQEALTEIIDHEIMHAFINDPAITVSQQHDIMLTTFLGDLVSANEQVNPGLTGRDATALALYGLSSLNYFDETAPNFQSALSANNLTLGDINSIYQAYTVGINGVISGHQPH